MEGLKVPDKFRQIRTKSDNIGQIRHDRPDRFRQLLTNSAASSDSKVTETGDIPLPGRALVSTLPIGVHYFFSECLGSNGPNKNLSKDKFLQKMIKIFVVPFSRVMG